MVGKPFLIHVEPQVQEPLKLTEKIKYFNYIIKVCQKFGATDVSIRESFYWHYKLPNKPKVFEFIIKLNSNRKTVANICNFIMTEFLNSYENPAQIWIQEGTVKRFSFAKEGNKVKLQAFTISKNTPIAINTKVIQIIRPEEYIQTNEKQES